LVVFENNCRRVIVTVTVNLYFDVVLSFPIENSRVFPHNTTL
jgi:hypothetical protein